MDSSILRLDTYTIEYVILTHGISNITLLESISEDNLKDMRGFDKYTGVLQLLGASCSTQHLYN